MAEELRQLPGQLSLYQKQAQTFLAQWAKIPAGHFHRTCHGRVLRQTSAVREALSEHCSGKKVAEDQKRNLYCREYKRYFAWIKAGKISEEQFTDGAKRAQAKEKDCDAEKRDYP